MQKSVIANKQGDASRGVGIGVGGAGWARRRPSRHFLCDAATVIIHFLFKIVVSHFNQCMDGEQMLLSEAEGEGRVVTEDAVGSCCGHVSESDEASVVAEPAGLHSVGGI